MKKRKLSSSKRRRDTISVSLFPFLVVLICTMGVLILLLVIFTHQARLQAAEEARRKVEKENAEVAVAAEDVQGRIESLKNIREKTNKSLAEVRLKLGLVEDHSRRLEEKLKQLESTRKQMEQMQADGVKRQQLEAELAETEANIASIKADIAEAKQKAKSQSRSFRPVISVEGYSGTTRIPICVECRSDTVVIQPEGIVLTETDFEGPMGPGNPLAAALRAAREHMLVEMGKSVDSGDINLIEPYPLLLVRPDGTMSYNCVRHAMKSWGPDFGYELVDNNWKIDYGKPNQQRALAMQEALDAARLQQIRLAAAAPRHYPEPGLGPTGGSRYTTTGQGGVVAYRGNVRKSKYRTPGERLAARRAALGETSAGGSDSAPGGRYAEGSGSGWTPGGTGPGNGLATGNGSGGIGLGTGNGLAKKADGVSGSGLSTSGSDGTGNASGTNNAGGDSMLASSGSGDGESMLGSSGPDLNNQAHSGSGLSSGSQAGGGQGSCPAGSSQQGFSLPGQSQQGMAQQVMAQSGSGQTGSGQTGTAQSSNVQINAGESGSPDSAAGETPEDLVVRPQGYANDVQQQGRYGSALRPGEWVPTDPRHRPTKIKNPQTDGKKRLRRASGHLAGKRGKNWALPGSAPSATPLVRPIKIECRPDRLILEPETGLAGRQEVVLDTYTSDSINEFVAAVWHYMDNSWGIAGQGMYWKPILKVEVAPGGERRFRDLQALLDGSGFRIERKK